MSAQGPGPGGGLPSGCVHWARRLQGVRGMATAEDPAGCPCAQALSRGYPLERQVSSDLVLQNYHIPAGGEALEPDNLHPAAS